MYEVISALTPIMWKDHLLKQTQNRAQ